MLHKMIILVGLLLTTNLMAQVNYDFNSNLKFKFEQSLGNNQLDVYTLNEQSDVKLLIGLLEKKSFYIETKKLSDNAIKDSFFEKEVLLDVINGQSERKILGFKRFEENGHVIIQFRYSLVKNSNQMIEANTYVIEKEHFAFSSIQYPITISSSIQSEIEKGIKNFKIINNDQTVFNRIQETIKSAMTFYKVDYLYKEAISNLGSLLVDAAFAAKAPNKFKACHKSDYIQSGDFTTKPGSALFNFGKIFRDIKDEATKLTVLKEENSKAKIDESKLDCLSQYYREAKKNATDHWQHIGEREGCFDDGKIIESASATCSDSTLKEMKKSFAYLDNIDKQFDDYLKGEVAENYSCLVQPKFDKDELDLFKKLGVNAQQSFCCGNGNGEPKDMGPLYMLMNSEDANFKNLSPSTRAELCIQKTKDDPSKSFLSGQGLGDCAGNVLKGLGHLISETIKTVSSLFDIATLKALGQFVADLPDSGKQLFQAIGEQLAAQVYSISSCMSPYEAKQHMCKMVPNVAAMLLGPGLIKSFAKALIDKSSKSALAKVIAEAAGSNKQFQRMKEIAQTVSSNAGKVTRPIIKSRFVKPSLEVLSKLKRALGTDVSTPIKEMVLKKVKVTNDKVRELAQNRLRRSQRVIAEEVTDQDAASAASVMVRRSKPDVEDVVENADGVYRPLPEETGTRVAIRNPNTPATTPAPSLSKTDMQPQLRLTNSRGTGKTASPPSASVTRNHIEMVDDIRSFRQAVSSGNKDLADDIKKRMNNRAATLTNEERVSIAMEVNGRAVDPLKVIKAHEVGGTGRKIGEYTPQEIAEKARIAKAAGLSKETRRDLINAGVLGGEGASSTSYISLTHPQSGVKIPGKFLGKDEKGFLVEYINLETGQNFTRVFSDAEMRSLKPQLDPSLARHFEKPAVDLELSRVFDEIEAETRTVGAQVARVEAPRVEAPVAPAAPVKPAPQPAPAKAEPVLRSETPSHPAAQSGYVNDYGVARADLKPGDTVSTQVSTMDGVRQVNGEVLLLHVDPNTGVPQVQIRWQDGVITDRGHVQQGKPNLRVDNVDVESIRGVIPSKPLPSSVAEPVAPKPISSKATTPKGSAVDPDSYDGKYFRAQADREAVEMLLKEHRVGERAHIESLKKQIQDDYWVRVLANRGDSNTIYVSKLGTMKDARFDPKIYYAHRAEEYHSAINSAKKISKDGSPLDYAERDFLGQYSYASDGTRTRMRSARDEAIGFMKSKGKSEAEIKALVEWMDKYDATIPRAHNFEKAVEAQKKFEAMKPKLERAISDASSVTPQVSRTTFDEMSQHLKDMLLNPKQKEAAEAALKRIKCARPEWSVSDNYNGFNLSCN